jgi:hypothetical protein
MKYKAATALVLFVPLTLLTQKNSDHHSGVVNRGDRVMGFSHEKTTHHFRLLGDGGRIEAVANDTADTASRQQIREHLQHIANMFKQGDFDAPMLIHCRTPPGVPTMKRLREQIEYRLEDLPNGARVRISSHNPKAVAAIHDFLRFQIQDHHTGDAAEIRSE